jgi:hypothetical protein
MTISATWHVFAPSCKLQTWQHWERTGTETSKWAYPVDVGRARRLSAPPAQFSLSTEGRGFESR